MAAILDPNDAKLFYDLWNPLIDYVNETYHVNPNLLKLAESSGQDINEIRVVIDYLWDHPETIDDYLAFADLPEKHKFIVASWKRFVRDNFVLERHRNGGSIFIKLDENKNDKVYLVKGIYSSLQEMTTEIDDPPMMVTATLIPFKDTIIIDGVIVFRYSLAGSRYENFLKNLYYKAKDTNTIQVTL